MCPHLGGPCGAAGVGGGVSCFDAGSHDSGSLCFVMTVSLRSHKLAYDTLSGVKPDIAINLCCGPLQGGYSSDVSCCLPPTYTEEPGDIPGEIPHFNTQGMQSMSCALT